MPLIKSNCWLFAPPMQIAPVTAEHLWEFCAFFCSYYLCNRLMMLHLHTACEGGDLEMWRGSQMWVWVAPNHCKAIWKVRAIPGCQAYMFTVCAIR